MQTILSTEVCKKCSTCCKGFPYVEISNDDIKRLEQHTHLNPIQFCNAKSQDIEIDEGHFLKFKDNGECIFLKTEQGGSFCGVYKARPNICGDYPSSPAQYKTCDNNIAISQL